MEKVKDKLLVIFSSIAFVVLMMVNVSVSMDVTSDVATSGSCISLAGISALAASPSESDCRKCVADASKICDLYSEWIIGMRNNNCP